MRKGIAGGDVVMMLRLQLERMDGALVPSTREYFRFFGLDREKLAWPPRTCGSCTRAR